MKKKIFVIVVFCFLIALSVYFAIPQQAQSTLTVNSKRITIELADTPEKQVQGLSGRTMLAKNSGMFFTFSYSGNWGIWMKDMLFPIDILWLDSEFKVVGMKENAWPESYPEAFYPDALATYVLEVNTGFIKENNIIMGSQFNLNQ